MALLDLQTLEIPEEEGLDHYPSAYSRRCGVSTLSLLLCS
ncbi:class III lanthipeptide [Streptomyces sp. L2]|nr:class III lanthipeptide [Streptomyces sp. L2]